jgi:glucose-6-phosphate dehydrogenase assembly protein OpcA
VTDLRWTKLTRWRGLLAHLFDLPQVLGAAGTFERLTIEAADLHAGRLFAGWLAARLRWTPDVAITVSRAEAPGGGPLRALRLDGPAVAITLTLKPTGTCLEAVVEGTVSSARAVPIANGGLSALIGEELAVRTRDLAFEQALARAQEIRA